MTGRPSWPSGPASREQYGAIDVLVNNAGISPRSRPGDPDQMQKWDEVVSINLTGQWDMSVSLLDAMKHPGASMIFLSSIAGFSAPRSSAAYGATKAGIRSLVQYFARTLGPTGGRANGLAPGRMFSGLMTADGRVNAKFLAAGAAGSAWARPTRSPAPPCSSPRTCRPTSRGSRSPSTAVYLAL